MKKHLLTILISLFILFQTSAYAALDLELTQGIDSALPIAVVNFSGEASFNPSQQLSQVISDDLQNSGRFKLLQGNKAHQPHRFQTVEFAYWKKLGANDLVIGNIQSLGNNRSVVNVELLDVLSSNPILFSKRFTVNNQDMRRLAHHISDLIYQQLTGERGIFSTRIAYVLVQNQGANKPVKYTLEVADADGYNPQPLLVSYAPIMSPAWSPNGKQIAYVSLENKRSQIYIVNVATGKRRLITQFVGINGAPAWSPDGQQLALVLSKSGHPKIYIVNLANGGLKQVTFGSSIDTEPSWSVDGKSIIFTSNRGGGPQIYHLNLASGKVNRMTFTGGYNASASYTPKGQSIVMLHRANGAFNIAMQNIGNGQVSSLTNNGKDESPSLAPNGKMVIFATNENNKEVLSIVSTDGRVRLNLPSRDGNVKEPAWSPFLG